MRPSGIVLENLHIRGMVKNHNLAQAIQDASMGEIRRQLEYKCAWLNINLEIADQWYPSTKRCSRCGHKKENLALSERVYHCHRCHIRLDRDFNAAINLAQLSKQIEYR